MREVDDARDAEDQRQAGRDEEQRRARRRRPLRNCRKKRRERQAQEAPAGVDAVGTRCAFVAAAASDSSAGRIRRTSLVVRQVILPSA